MRIFRRYAPSLRLRVALACLPLRRRADLFAD